MWPQNCTSKANYACFNMALVKGSNRRKTNPLLPPCLYYFYWKFACFFLFLTKYKAMPFFSPILFFFLFFFSKSESRTMKRATEVKPICWLFIKRGLRRIPFFTQKGHGKVKDESQSTTSLLECKKKEKRDV